MPMRRTSRIILAILALLVSATGAVFGASGIASAATALPVLTSAPTTTSGGVTLPTYTDQQVIAVSAAANTTFGSHVGISIIECADPSGTVGNLPTSPANCDGQTIPGDTILTGTDGSFNYVAGGNAGNYSGLSMFGLPSAALGEPANASPKCDLTHACVLYIGTNQNDFTQPFVFSSPFYVAVPTVASISPTTGPAAGGTSVTISGTDLAGATSVKFGATAAAITADTATSITATAPAGTGTVDVTVTVTAGGIASTSATGSADHFTYVAVPTVTGVSPTSGPALGDTSVTITGTGLSGASAVTFGATAATSYSVNSATSITATAPAGTGTVDVTVTTTGGTSATGSADHFTYVAAPVATGVSPTTGPPAGGTSVTITGTDLAGATSVKFGATAAAITADSATSITATAPAGTGTVDVTVTTASGTSATSAADHFTYGAPAAITSANSTSFTDGEAGTFTPTATGTPTPTITESGSLPTGVTFSGGVLSGTTTVAPASYPITFTAHNGIGSDAVQAFTLTVLGFHVTTTSLPDAVVGTAYSQQLQTAGAGSVVPTWKKGSLPKGFALSSTGLLTGTPSAKATGPFTVTATVALGKSGTPISVSLPLTVDEAPAFGKKSPIAASFNEGIAGTATVTATGYPVPAITETGALPSGVTFIDGVLSGTPAVTTDSATYNLAITASNGIAPAASESFTLTVYAPLLITTTSIPGGSVGGAYPSTPLTATGGIGTYTWKKVGSLPKGLSLSSTGVLSGTLSTKLVSGTSYPFTVSVGVTEGKLKVSMTKTLTLVVS